LAQVLMVLLWALHLVSSVLLMAVVLLQSGRGGGVAGIFGGGAGESAFGVKTGTLLGKVTAGVATFFVVSAVVIAMLSSRVTAVSAGSVDKSDKPVDTTSGAVETPKAPAPETPTETPGETPKPPADETKKPAEEPKQPDAGAPEKKADETKPTGWAPLPEDAWLA